MPDTQRTISELQTILADNTSRNITPQDLRDMLVTLEVAHGSICVTTPVETAIGTVDTPIKMLGTTALTSGAQEMDMPVNNRLRYVGGSAKVFNLALYVGTTAAGNNKDQAVYIAKNGTVISQSKIDHRLGTGADHKSISTGITALAVTNDYFEAWIENETDDTNMTAETMMLTAVGHAT